MAGETKEGHKKTHLGGERDGARQIFPAGDKKKHEKTFGQENS